MSATAKMVCPRCRAATKVKHCNNKVCTWKACTKCTNDMHTSIVFEDTRFFIREQS